MQLSQYLEAQELTPSRFAKRNKLSKSFICRLIKGERMPSVPMAKRLEKLTKGSVPWTEWFEAEKKAA